MSILKVNNIERATSGSSVVTFTDDVTFSGSVNISQGSITASFEIANASIGKEKLTNDARDFVNILNKPAGLISSSDQFVTSISGSSLSLGGIVATGSIRTTDVFSGSGAQLFGLPNAALNNSQITINGVAVSLGGTRTLTTSDITEGTNQYYTDARVKAKLNTETVVSSSGQINYQSVTGQPTVNTLGSDGNKSFTITTGIFVTASGGADGIVVTNDTANYTLRLRTVGGTVSSSAQVQAALPGGVVSSSAQYPGWMTSSTQVVWASVPYNSNIVSSSAQFTTLTDPFSGSFSGSFNGRYTGSILSAGVVSASSQYPGWVTASSQIDYNSITNKLSGVVSSSGQVQPLLPGGTVSSSAQYPGLVTASSQIVVQNTTGISAIATTGSNTFIGNQTISGSTTITGNLTVQGTSSVLYVTSSQLNVGSNLITLNTDTVLRYGGLAVYDSASLTNQSGSLLWDSLNNVWLFVHAGTSNTSSIVITGPENTGALGSEQFLTPNLLPKAGITGDHIVNSQISDNGTQVGIVGGLKVTGSITSSHIVPAVTDIYDLGSPTLKFRDLYLSGSTLYLGSLAIRDNGGSLSIGPSGSAVGTNSPVSGAFTGSFRGNGSQLTNISNSALPGGVISSSTQLPAGTVSSSAQYPGWVTASSQIDYNSITNKLSGVYSSSTQIANNLPAGTVSSSGQINAGATANFATAVAAQLGTVHSGSFMSTATTNNLPEGVTNLYYTDARVKAKLNNDVVHSGSFLGTATTDNLTQGSTNRYYADSLVLNYINSLSVLSSSQQVVDRLPTGTVSSSTQISSVLVTSASYAATASLALGVSGSLAVSTDGLNEGSINLYYTDARVKTKLNVENVHSASFLGTATTTNLTEGVNLYFTNQRVKDALPGVISSSTQLPILLPGGVVSSSAQYPGWVTSSLQINTGSFSGSFTGDGSGLRNIGAASLPAGTVSSSAQVISNIAGQTITPTTVNATNITASALTANQAIFTNASDGFVSNPITGTGNVVMSASPTLTGTITAANITATGTMLLAGILSQSSQVDITATTGYTTFSSSLATVDTTQQVSINALNAATSSYAINSTIQSQLAGVVSSSAQVKPLLPDGTVTSSAQYPGWVTASSQIDYNLITNKLSGVYSSSAFTSPSQGTARLTLNGVALGDVGLGVQSGDSPTFTGLTVTATSSIAGHYSSSAQVDAAIVGQVIEPATVNATNILSASVLQTSTNALIGGKLAVTGSTEFTGTVTASNLTANQAVFTNASDGLVSNAITGTGNVVMSASPTLTGTVTANNIVMSGSQFAGIVSGSGLQYRLVVPVGTNYYAT